MRIATLIATALLAFAAAPSPAAKPEPAAASNVVTVFVAKGSPGSLVKAVNALHAKMEAEGWAFSDMNVYTEDGDLEGLFVTYVRAPSVTALPSPPSPGN